MIGGDCSRKVKVASVASKKRHKGIVPASRLSERTDESNQLLKTTLKAEMNPEAWGTLNSDTSRPFDKPKNGKMP